MLRTIKTFLLLILGYHIIVTFLGYGILDGEYIKHIAIIKDLLRIGIVFMIGITHLKSLKGYRTKWKYVWISFFVFVIFGILISLLHQKSIYNIFIGLKYGIQFIVILLTASILGYILAKKKSDQGKQSSFVTLSLSKGIRLLRRSSPHKDNTLNITTFQGILIGTVIIGFLWQILKYTRPELLHIFGYGPVGDFVFGTNPPLYYRTGPLAEGGISRRQGLFSGPNNYGYFLVSMFPLILLWFKPNIKKLKELFHFNISNLLGISMVLLRIATIILTFSRTAMIGGGIVFLIVYKNRLKQHKKILRGIIGAGILGIIGLSILKGGSTLQHITNKRESIQLVINNPSGFGLGTAGPAIHHQGTILPENYFLQLMIDVGTIGFILWTFIFFQIMYLQKKIYKDYHPEPVLCHPEPVEGYNSIPLLTLKYMSIGRTALLIMGLFLHVFEDSMVNYLFFIPYGILLGYLSAYIKKEQKSFWEFFGKQN